MIASRTQPDLIRAPARSVDVAGAPRAADVGPLLAAAALLIITAAAVTGLGRGAVRLVRGRW
jgi:hypothetical protein